MNRRVLLLIVGSLLLPLGCAPTGPAVPLVLEPSELCSDHADYAIATFEDATLEAAIRAALSVGAQEPLTCGLIFGVRASGDHYSPLTGITSLVGIQNLTNLTFLVLEDNSITDISALSGLTSLAFLELCNNSITELGALSGLTSLTFLDLQSTKVSCTDVAALRAKGVFVSADCP